MALKRQQTASMFDSLKSASLNESSESSRIDVENGQQFSTSMSDRPITTQEKEHTTEELHLKPPKASEKSVTKKNSDEDSVNNKSSIKGYDFGYDKKKETKSVRKQFVLTPSDAAWLKETARLNGISENKVIENMIKMMKNK